MNILLAVDGSPQSLASAEYLARHVSIFGGEHTIVVFTVHPAIPYPGIAALLGQGTLDDYYRDESNVTLAASCAPLDAAGIAHDLAFAIGDPATEICASAKSHSADLIVMGSHGQGAVKNLVLGSVAMKVLASTRVPVLLVR